MHKGGEAECKQGAPDGSESSSNVWEAELEAYSSVQFYLEDVKLQEQLCIVK